MMGNYHVRFLGDGRIVISLLLPDISLLLDVAVMSLMEQGEDLKRRYWFVMDELAALNRLPALEVYITRLRKKQKNISFGAHEHRDGESYTEQERSKPLIDINDFKLLNPLEAYVLLPEAEVAIGKIKSEIQAPPKNTQPFFIPKPN